MSYRLYPDIIVAAKIIDSYRRYPDLKQTYISIESCLTMQGICKNMGIENVFTGSETKENWDDKDYVKFFKSLPQYFIRDDNDFYRIKFESMSRNIDEKDLTEEDVKLLIREKIIQHSYSDRLLGYLGLT